MLPSFIGSRLLLLVGTVLLVAAIGEAKMGGAGTEAALPGTAEELYSSHCAICHGTRGRADGVAAGVLFPPARDFSRGTFRLVSSRNGAPRDGDLIASIEHGLPGTSMPAFPWLSADELAGLARHVRKLATDGLAERLEASALSASSEESSSAIRARAVERLTPDEPFAALPEVLASDDLLRRGKELYTQRCAVCHASDGSGTPEPRRNDDGEVSWARDLTQGYLKGGSTRQDIAHRIQAGMPGSTMPATLLESQEDLAALVEYVVAMLPQGAAEEHMLRRERLTAKRVESLENVSHDDALWQDAQRIHIRLTPLWWRPDSIDEVTLFAVHDGTRLALRAQWPDSTSKPRISDDAQRVDAIALQFSNAPRPVLFGMGTGEHPTSIWHWKALRMREVAGWMDLIGTPDPAGSDPGSVARIDVPVYHGLDGVESVSSAVESIHGRGISPAGLDGRSDSPVEVLARPVKSGWDVLFVRALKPLDTSDATFETGGEVQVSVAVWNGAAGDRGAQKSISIWQALRLAP